MRITLHLILPMRASLKDICGKLSSDKSSSGINLFKIFLLFGPQMLAVAK